jgi:hypothetical protein
MNTTSQVTINKNPLAVSDGFKMVFKRAPNVSYFCQNFAMPSVTANEVIIGRPKFDAHVPGDKLQFDPLTVTMLVAENMENYVEIFNWMMNNPNNEVDDITLYILSSKNNVNRTIVFKNAFPTNIGSINFNVQDSDITYAQVDVTFRYDYFTFSDAQGTNTIGP